MTVLSSAVHASHKAITSDGAGVTSITSKRWQKWFTETETGQIITVTGQIPGHPYYNQSCTSEHPAPFPT